MRYLMLFSFPFICLSAAFCQTDTTHYDAIDLLGIVYTVPDIPAKYPYGRDSLTRFLYQNLPAKWHSHYMKNLYVVVQFTVRRDSTLSNITFVSGNKNLFEDAVKAVKLSEPWIPGIYKSKNVPTLEKLKVKFPQPG